MVTLRWLLIAWTAETIGKAYAERPHTESADDGVRVHTPQLESASDHVVAHEYLPHAQIDEERIGHPELTAIATRWLADVNARYNVSQGLQPLLAHGQEINRHSLPTSVSDRLMGQPRPFEERVFASAPSDGAMQDESGVKMSVSLLQAENRVLTQLHARLLSGMLGKVDILRLVSLLLIMAGIGLGVFWVHRRSAEFRSSLPWNTTSRNGRRQAAEVNEPSSDDSSGSQSHATSYYRRSNKGKETQRMSTVSFGGAQAVTYCPTEALSDAGSDHDDVAYDVVDGTSSTNSIDGGDLPDVEGACFGAIAWKLNSTVDFEKDGEHVMSWQRRHFYLKKEDGLLKLIYISERLEGSLKTACAIKKQTSSEMKELVLPQQAMQKLSVAENNQVINDMRTYDLAFEDAKLSQDTYEAEIPSTLYPFVIIREIPTGLNATVERNSSHGERIILATKNQRLRQKWMKAMFDNMVDPSS